uniref:Methyltransferase type 11 domain-containing protein n=1 Tax=Arcella intermedia TaxID=1963864 RepID=A0A6B2LD70_9EUKA
MHAWVSDGYTKESVVYDKVRPSYPDAALQWIVEKVKLCHPDPSPTILDLAAGTGKFTRCLLNHLPKDVKLIAIEPVDNMRKILQDHFSDNPEIQILPGTAQKTGLESKSIDIITIAQAFHWFANQETLDELLRILKPNGYLILIWNSWQKDIPWIDQIRALTSPLSAQVPQYSTGEWKKIFSVAENHIGVFVEETGFTCDCPMDNHTPSRIWDQLLSRSWVAVLSEKEKEELKLKVWEILRNHNQDFQDVQDMDTSTKTTPFPHITKIFAYKPLFK